MAKKVIMYGNANCPHCVAAKELLDREGIRYGFVDVLASLGHLKKFLAVRDAHPEAYRQMVAEGRIGLPTIVVDDTDLYVVTLDGVDLETLK